MIAGQTDGLTLTLWATHQGSGNWIAVQLKTRTFLKIVMNGDMIHPKELKQLRERKGPREFKIISSIITW